MGYQGRFDRVPPPPPPDANPDPEEVVVWLEPATAKEPSAVDPEASHEPTGQPITVDVPPTPETRTG